MLWHRADETSRRLETIPGVGITATTALAASIPDPAVFKTGRQFAAFQGLVPRQNSSGGKDCLGRISKRGDRYLRRLLVLGATSVVLRVGTNTSATGTWVRGSLERKPSRVVTVAIANKTHAARPIAPEGRIASLPNRRATSPLHIAVRANVSDDDQRGRNQENPRLCLGARARCSERDLVCGLHQGQLVSAPRAKARHMTVSRIDQTHPDLPMQKSLDYFSWLCVRFT